MSRYKYFNELSGDSSDGCSSDSDSNDFVDHSATVELRGSCANSKCEKLRTIVHADVDCFYCQCETLDRGLDPERPLAIGQKHIVVTCNYAARAFGVTKLMSRDDAGRLCPHLLIVDGSDLQRYRVHGRRIYESFRRGIQLLRPGSAVCKGSMDEMTADVHEVTGHGSTLNDASSVDDIYVYDSSNHGNPVITMTEDQSGAQTLIVRSNQPDTLAPNDEALDPDGLRKLLDTAAIALKVRQTIYDETGFTTTIGVSFNPLMAKLASGLRKPGKVNLLKPSSSSRLLVEAMPLRKVPGIGSRTMKVLLPCLLNRHGSRIDATSAWTCSDLLQVPRIDIIRCLQKVDSGGKSSAEHCSNILDLCVGQDKTSIVDDQGGLQKTLSIENSFRRGTLRTKEQILDAMEDLYRRLPHLLKDRTEWSSNPTRAYPTTIRLTARFAVSLAGKSGGNRRPFETRSHQVPCDGQSLVNKKVSGEDASALLRRFVAPLAQSLIFSGGNNMDVTRLNIGLTNFQDIALSPNSKKSRNKRKR